MLQGMGAAAGSPVLACPSCGAKNRVPVAAARGVPRCGSCKAALPWLVDAGAKDFDAAVVASVPVVVDFWAAWCGPCRLVGPVLEDLARDHAGRLKVVKVDVDAHPGLSARFGVQGIPTLLVFRDGQVADRIVGALARTALEPRLGLAAPRR